MENRGIKVSIIVPVYNGETTVSRCIDSISAVPHKYDNSHLQHFDQELAEDIKSIVR